MSAPIPRHAARVRPTARTLYRIFVGFALLGIVLPLVTFVLKPAGEDFRLWRNKRGADSDFARLLEEHPLLDLERTWPFLARVSWHSSRETAFLDVYRTHAALNVLVVVAALLFRRRLLRRLEPWAEWLRGGTHRRARLTVLVFASGIWFCYATQSSLGFYFPGIGGWTYRGWSGIQRSALEPDPAGGRAPSAEERAFLERAVLAENARYLPEAGYLTGRAMFLHYETGEVLPASYELTNMVFPRYYFGGKHQVVSDPRTFGAVLRESLGRWRRFGGRFLLPAALAYPNHAVYQPIDYSGYPEPEQLASVSFWLLTLHIDDERDVELVTASRELAVDVRPD